MYYAITKATDTQKLYLQGVKPNENYCKSGTAPTMGNMHTYCEYSTIWSENPKHIEPLTASSYIKTIFEEFRWKERTPFYFTVEPISDEEYKNGKSNQKENKRIYVDY